MEKVWASGLPWQALTSFNGCHGEPSSPPSPDVVMGARPLGTVKVSMSTMTSSSLETRSPSPADQETILPSVMVELSIGMKISRILARTILPCRGYLRCVLIGTAAVQSCAGRVEAERERYEGRRHWSGGIEGAR